MIHLIFRFQIHALPFACPPAQVPERGRNRSPFFLLRRQTGHRAPVDLEFDVVGFDANNQSIITNRNDGAHDPPEVTTVCPFCRFFSIAACCFRWRCMGMNTNR